MKKLLFVTLSALLIIPISNTAAQKVKGKVLDQESGKPIQYVNVGVIGKEVGSITNSKGDFEFNLKNATGADTLRISMMGYEPISLLLKDFPAGEAREFRLKESSVNLDEVVITYQRDNTKELGTKGVSGIMQTGWGYGVTGGERGVRLASKRPYVIDEINFHVASIGYDSVLLRLHLRSLPEKLKPGDELIVENIFLKVRGNEKGWVTRDLSQYNISVEGDAVVSLELVARWGKCTISDCFHLSMAVPGGVFLFKEFSFSNWGFRKSRSPSIYVKVYYL